MMWRCFRRDTGYGGRVVATHPVSCISYAVFFLRQIGVDQLQVLEFGPEVRRDGVVEMGEVLLQLRRRASAGDDGRHRRMAQRELQRCGWQRYMVARADSLDLAHAFQNFRRGRQIVVVRPRFGPGGENT